MLKVLKSNIAMCGAALLALIGLGMTPALAQTTGFYIGGGIGLTSSDLCAKFTGATSCDDEDTGIKIFGGYNVNQNLAVEAGWVDLGEVSVTGPGASATLEADGFQVAAVGILPINPQFSVLGKLGIFFWDASASVTGFPNVSDDGADIMFGLGGAWNFMPQFSLRAEWERYDVDEDVDMLSVSIVYRF